MNTYKIRTVIPSLSSFIYLNELTNKNLLDINKFISSNDSVGLDEYFSNLLPSNINIYDKLFLIVFLRYKCLGEEIKLTKISSSDSIQVSVNLANILEKLFNCKIEKLNPFTYKNLKINFKYPSKLYFEKYFDLLEDIVENIEINSLKLTNKIDINEALSKLKPEILNNLINYVREENKNVLYISDSVLLKDLNLTFYNNSCFNLIKLFLTYNVSNIYLKMFHMTEKLNINYSDFLKLTPLESDILLTIYKSVKNIK
jgi:hypothetical protein